MKILLTGGGSGGHITPILAVADELKKLDPAVRLIYVGQTGDKFADIPRNHESIDEVYEVRAGKFRRYHGEGFKQLLDIKTIALNVRDSFRFLIGTWQSQRLIKRLQPSIVFIKGGFVGVPVGLGAAWRKVPYITHDSDAVPGLANRILARWAKAHAVALPVEVYNYPKDKTYHIGVPVSDKYQKVSVALQTEYRRGLNLPIDARVMTITGGGLGADRLNRAIIDISASLLENYPNLYILHLAGRGHDQTVTNLYRKALDRGGLDRVIVKGFVHDLYRYSAAADLIITRAGASTLAEFAAQSRACIVVPNPILTGGHQTKNADYLLKQRAAVIVRESQIQDNPKALLTATKRLLDFSDKRERLAHNLHALAKTKAASELARLIIDNAE